MKALKTIGTVLNVVITVVLVVIILGASVLAITARRSPDKIPTVMGRKVLTVLSGSMEPRIHTGDVIIVNPLRATDEIKEGDVVTFRVKDKPDMLITHRIVGTILVNGKPLAFTTKGDANDSPDLSPIGRDQVLGKYQSRVLYAGYLTQFMHKPIGIVVLLILPGVILIGSEVRKIYLTLAEAEAQKAKAQAAQAAGGDRSEP